MASFKQLKEKRDARQFSLSIKTEPSSHSNDDVTVQDASEKAVALDEIDEVKVKRSSDKGRGLYWCPKDDRRLGRGTTILRLNPELTVPTSQSVDTLCHRCFSETKDGKALQRCSGCKVLRYCSTTCQKTDWPAHRQECKALQGYRLRAGDQSSPGSAPSEPGTTIRLLGRLVWERQRLGQSWWSKVEALESKRGMITANSPSFELPMLLARYLGVGDDPSDAKDKMKELGFANAAEILDLISRISLNSFATYTSDLTAVGISLSTVAAMINHSCNPNVAIVYPNGPGADRPMHVVAIKDIEAGEELTTFYIDVSDPVDIRQDLLQKRYGFRCTCDLCVRNISNGKKKKIDPRTAIWCGRHQCNGWVEVQDLKPTGQCSKCKLDYVGSASEVQQTMQKGIELLNNVNGLVGRGEMMQALQISKVVMKGLTRIMPPSSYPLLGLLRQLQTALILCAASHDSLRDATVFYEEAIRFHMLSLAAMQAANGTVYCIGHPVRAIAMATLATLLVREATSPEEVKVSAGISRHSDYLSRIPPVPPMGPARDQAGIALMAQAIDELKIAYGIDEDGGEPGRKLIAQVREWKESEAIMARTRA